jgi:hypothetical protein
MSPQTPECWSLEEQQHTALMWQVLKQQQVQKRLEQQSWSG